MANIFKGIGVALVTPFNQDGTIDFNALESLAENVISSGADFLCVLGTTAETPTLSLEEKRNVMEVIVKVNSQRVPLMLGVGGNCTTKVCEYLRTEDISAFQGILSVAPYYNKPTQEGIYQHFKAVSAASPLPIILYNIPGRTGVNIIPSTVVRIVNECRNVVAIKEASGNIAQAEEIIMQTPESFDVISGDDSLTCELLKRGASGVISVVANAYTKEFRNFINHNGIDECFKKIISLTMVDGNPSGIKAILNVQGKCENVLRLPLVPVSERVHKEIIETIVNG